MLGIATGVGVVIHGLHWSVMGFVEAHYGELEGDDINGVGAYETFWHDKPVALQVFLGPLKLAYAIALFLFIRRNIKQIAVEENVPCMNNDRMEAFQFLQDYYLYFAQFYAHVSYACALGAISLVVYIVGFGVSSGRVALVALLYLITGFLSSLGGFSSRLCS